MTTYRLSRNMLNRVLGGICGGIGAYLGVSGWWVRIAFLALLLTAPSVGLLTYLLLWVLLPSQTIRELPPVLGPGDQRPMRYARAETLLILGLGTILIGVLVMLQSAGFLQGPQGDLLAPGLLFAVGLVLLIKQVRGRA